MNVLDEMDKNKGSNKFEHKTYDISIGISINTSPYFKPHVSENGTFRLAAATFV